MKPIVFPGSLDLENSLAMAAQIQGLAPGSEYLFDFTRIRWIGPFGMVLLSTCLEDAVSRLGPQSIYAQGHRERHYMAHMGFFRAFGLKHGNAPGQAKGSSSYRPITDIECNPYYSQSVQGGVALGELMEEQAKQITSVLIQQVEGDLFDTLTFAIREILRNALEHSQTKVVRYCAQFWPDRDMVEVAILDHGRGVKASLSRNPFIECDTDRAAINHALMPGVSGTAFKGSKLTRDDMWQNSGYGLYMTSRICRLGGSFFIGSYEASVLLSPAGKNYQSFGFGGTCVRMIIRPSQASNLSSRLKQFSLEGRKIAEQLKGTILKASTASQMVTDDFC